MDLKTLIQKGALVTGELVQKGVEWVHEDLETGEEVTDQFVVHIMKRMSFGAFDRVYGSAKSLDKSQAATLISEVVRFGEDGAEKLTVEQAHELHPGLAMVLVNAAQAVYAELKKQRDDRQAANSGNSAQPTNSGAS